MRRWWLTLVYVLGTLAAQVGHDHGPSRGHAPEALASCLDAGAHFAGHPDAPDLDRDHEACAVCAARFAPTLTVAAFRIKRSDAVQVATLVPAPTSSIAEHSTPSARAPPLA
jgi:hypothetical protein